jgi:geranylgeranyl diphosphate synthase, type II
MHNLTELNALFEQTFTADEFNYEPASLYKPVMHIMCIPGKRIRPMLLLMACEAFEGNLHEALHPSYAIEVFHNFTLVHDDIMDEAALRRGHPTVHTLFGLNAGILAGDAMLSYAYKYLCTFRSHSLPDILDVFNKTTIEIYEGQQMDVDFENRLDVTIAEYMKMIEYKTSVLLACALQIGAIIGGASQADRKLMYDFGLKLGLSFQIKDDWLDTFGVGAKVGKTIGGDILQNKKTFLFISALQMADDADRATLLSLLHETDGTRKIAGVRAIYDKYHISETTLAQATTLYEDSLSCLKAVSLPETQKEQLYLIASRIHDRDF